MKKEALKSWAYGKRKIQTPASKIQKMQHKMHKKFFLIAPSADNAESIKTKQILRGGGNKQWGRKQCA
ncbi:hypothetical protein [Helicobacter sp. T3_23-1056]